MNSFFSKIISNKLTVRFFDKNLFKKRCFFFIQVAELEQMKNNLEPHLPTNKNENKKMHDLYELIIQIMKYMNEYCDTDQVSLSSDDETSNDVSLN